MWGERVATPTLYLGIYCVAAAGWVAANGWRSIVHADQLKAAAVSYLLTWRRNTSNTQKMSSGGVEADPGVG